MTEHSFETVGSASSLSQGGTPGRPRRLIRRLAGRLSLASAALLVGATAAAAQFAGAAPDETQEIVRPPRVEPPGEAGYILTYLVVLVLVGIAVGVTVMPGRRSHQD
jgi:hypothetical protein